MKQKPTIKPVVNSSGISLGGLIFIVFLALKLAGIGQVATWSWWWVTSPLWVGAAIVIGIAIIVALGTIVGASIITLVKYIKKKVQIESTGYLNINSIPVSKVVLDGKVIGNTPKVSVKLTPGVHQVILIHPDLGRFEKSVLVVAGETISVSHKF